MEAQEKIHQISQSHQVDQQYQTQAEQATKLRQICPKTYVTWSLNEAGTEYEINDTQTEQPDNWYDYTKGQWANIKTKQRRIRSILGMGTKI